MSVSVCEGCQLPEGKASISLSWGGPGTSIGHPCLGHLHTQGLVPHPRGGVHLGQNPEEEPRWRWGNEEAHHMDVGKGTLPRAGPWRWPLSSICVG